MRTHDSQSSSDPMPRKHRPYAAEAGHIPVLLHESLAALDIHSDDTVLDATLGGAGHAREIVSRLGPRGTFIGIDADADAITRAREALHGAAARIILIEGNFRDLESHLGKHGILKIDKALFDLGWSTYQLTAGRGFSFREDEPLLMTYSHSPALTAKTIVNTWAESSIADVLFGWGEERSARAIARAIVEARARRAIETSKELAAIVATALPRRGARLHPATKTFQALRIATNDELGALREGLGAAWRAIAPGGRLACISFHSIEDRVVKRLMREWETSGMRVYKKPLVPSRAEMRNNPRARSAKLRCMQKY